MGNKALIFDISTKRMKEDKLTDSEITKVYSTIAKELQSAGFDDRIQQSVYKTTNGDGINSLLTLLSKKDQTLSSASIRKKFTGWVAMNIVT